MLDITPDMLTELAEHHGRGEETGIILTADGWSVETWAGQRQPDTLVATTKQALLEWASSKVDEDIARAFLALEDYRIPDEDGDYTTPSEDADPQVVTGAWKGRLFGTGTESRCGAVTDWRDAWWFNRAQAVVLIPGSDLEYRETGATFSLWRTPGGRYVLNTRTRWGSSHYHETWTELSHAQVAEWAFNAREVADDVEQPPVVVAARAARQIVIALQAPEVPWFDGDCGRFHRADRVMDEAADIVHAAGAISDLLRTVVAPEIRAQRSKAARAVELAHGGNQTAAAEWLGMGRSTFANLLRN